MLFGPAAAAPAQTLPATIGNRLRTPTVTAPARGTAVAARGAHTAGTARGTTVTRNATSARPAAAVPAPAHRPTQGLNSAQRNAGMAALNRQFGMLGMPALQPSTAMNRTNQATPQTSQPRGQSGNATRGRGAPVGRQGRPHLRGGWLPVQGPKDRTGMADRETGSDSMLAEQLQNQELGFDDNNSAVDEIGEVDRGRSFRRSNTQERELSQQGHSLYRSRSPLFRRRRAPRNYEEPAQSRSYAPPPEQHTPMFPVNFPDVPQQPQQSSDFLHDEVTGLWGAENSHTADTPFQSHRGRQQPHSSSSLSEQDVRRRGPGAADATFQERTRRSPHDRSRSLDSSVTTASSQSSSPWQRQRRWSWDSGAGSNRPQSSRPPGISRRRPKPAGRYRSLREAFGATLRGLADLIS